MALIGSRTLHRNTKAVLDDIERTGEATVILRHNRPVAALVPIDQERAEALVLASSPEFREHQLASEASGDRKARPIEDVLREIDEREKVGERPTPSAGGVARLDDQGLEADETAEVNESTVRIGEVVQTLLGLRADAETSAAAEFDAEIAMIHTEIAEEVSAITSAVGRSIDAGAQGSGFEVEFSSGRRVPEIVRRQYENSLRLAQFLRTFLQLHIAGDAVLKSHYLEIVDEADVASKVESDVSVEAESEGAR
jgi:antitoxin (DNA-binding transcriptional repressor) of toxin-antitoxin stability system